MAINLYLAQKYAGPVHCAVLAAAVLAGPVFEHDRAQQLAVVGHRDEDVAVAVVAQGVQGRGVLGGGGQETVGPVRGHPDVPDLGKLAGQGRSDDHFRPNGPAGREDSRNACTSSM